MIFVIGANPTVNHPVAATWIKNAAKAGAKLIVADPRRSDLARHATYYLQFNADTDVALLNAMLHVIVEEGLVDEAFIRDRTSGYEALAENVKKFSPEAMAPICGIDATDDPRSRAALRDLEGVDHPLGHGHLAARARHRQRALPDRAGALDRPDRQARLGAASAARPEQRAGRVGLGPDPDVLSRLSARGHTRGARAVRDSCGTPTLDPDPGLTVVEIMNAAKKHEIRGMYIMGENPAMSDPDVDHAREALAALDHLVVQDIFLTETAYLADVVLPATAWPEKIGTVTNTDRMVQLGRKAIDPPGDAREDFWILNELARRIGVDWYYDHPRDVFNEMRTCMDSIAGITWERLERESSVTYPCVKEGDPGDPVVFSDTFPTKSGRAKFVPADLISAAERPDADYPMVLITGRQLEHWHTGSMTRRASNLDYIEPEPVASVHPLDLEAMQHRAGRHADDRIAARPDLTLRARRRWHAARRGVRAVLLLRGGGEHADQPGARSVREDSGVQVLRGESDRGRADARADEFRRRRAAAGV